MSTLCRFVADRSADLTVDGLIDILQEIRRNGHGETPVMRCDIEAGPCSITELFVQDDPEAYRRGETPAHVVILIA